MACRSIRAASGSPRPACRSLPDGPRAGSADQRRRPAIQVVLGEGIAREMGRYRTAAQLAAARNPQRLDVGDRFELDDRGRGWWWA